MTENLHGWRFVLDGAVDRDVLERLLEGATTARGPKTRMLRRLRSHSRCASPVIRA
jgi:hypothetical protein